METQQNDHTWIEILNKSKYINNEHYKIKRIKRNKLYT